MFNIVTGFIFVIFLVWGASFAKRTMGLESFVGSRGSRRGFQHYLYNGPFAPFQKPHTENYFYTNTGHVYPFDMQEILLDRNDMTSFSDSEMDMYFLCNQIITPRNSPGKC